MGEWTETADRKWRYLTDTQAAPTAQVVTPSGPMETRLLAAPTGVIFGPDVSHYQSGIDLAKVAAEGHQFVIAKVSQGATSRDSAWAVHRDGARRAGLLLIGYHMITGDNAAAQAANCKAALGDTSVPLALDWEESGGSGNWANFLAVLAAFRAAGLNVRLAYCPRWYWEAQGSPSMAAAGLPLWSSRYVSAKGAPAAVYGHVTAAQWQGYGGLPVGLIQFTDAATIAGLAVDCSAFRGTRAELATLLGGATPTSSATTPAADSAAASLLEVPVPIELAWSADGLSFWGVVGAECGAGSALFGGGWIKVSVGYANLGPVTTRIVALCGGAGTGPEFDITKQIPNNRTISMALPADCDMATVEGHRPDTRTRVNALWIPNPR